MKIKINKGKLNKAFAKAFAKTTEELADTCQNAIEADIYDWDRATLRSNGQVVTSPRDIVDTGQLLNSLEVETGAKTSVMTWNVDYAVQVHEGYTTRAGNEKPARPWTQVALNEINLEKVFAEALREELE